MIHYYYGDGKGKTTAAMGLALRAAGRGWRVTIAQFLKSDDSGERLAWAHVPGVTVLDIPKVMKFAAAMSPQERREAAGEMAELFHRAACSPGDLLVLDEIGSAVGTGLLAQAELLDFLEGCPPQREVVLTGYFFDAELARRADYVTQMKKEKHPFDQGTGAREGVEF